MKKRKIILGALLALTTTFILASCNNDNNSNSNSSENISTTTPSDNTVPSTTDNSTTNESSTDTTTSQETTTETIISFEELQTYFDNREEAPYNFGIEKRKEADSFSYYFYRIKNGVLEFPCSLNEGSDVRYSTSDYENIEFYYWEDFERHTAYMRCWLLMKENHFFDEQQQTDGSYVVDESVGSQGKYFLKKNGDGFVVSFESDTYSCCYYYDKYFYAYKFEQMSSTVSLSYTDMTIEWLTIDLSTLKQANN